MKTNDFKKTTKKLPTNFVDNYLYNNKLDNIFKFLSCTKGYLYSFKAATHGKTDAKPTDKIQGVCLKGWHIPNYDEILELTDYIENSDDLKCGDNCNFIAKALASTSGWNSSTQDCSPENDMSLNDATGFSAMPAGISCLKVGDVASFWTSEPYVLDFAYPFAISANGKRVTLSSGPYAYIASSVRCIKD